jgi:hypothetical protein
MSTLSAESSTTKVCRASARLPARHTRWVPSVRFQDALLAMTFFSTSGRSATTRTWPTRSQRFLASAPVPQRQQGPKRPNGHAKTTVVWPITSPGSLETSMPASGATPTTTTTKQGSIPTARSSTSLSLYQIHRYTRSCGQGCLPLSSGMLSWEDSGTLSCRRFRETRPWSRRRTWRDKSLVYMRSIHSCCTSVCMCNQPMHCSFHSFVSSDRKLPRCVSSANGLFAILVIAPYC